MADLPILFSAPMIRAILREIEAPGTGKTQTRRIIKPQPTFIEGSGRWSWKIPPAKRHECDHVVTASREWHEYLLPEQVPWPAVGDRLWVREAWWIATRYNYGTTPDGDELPPPPLALRSGNPVHYAADGTPPNCPNRCYGPGGLRGGAYAAPDPYAVWQKKPSIHMPRWASRLTLYVTEVKVQRLQDISEADALAEGIIQSTKTFEYDDDIGSFEKTKDWFHVNGFPDNGCGTSATDMYATLWNSINGSGSWDKNPWVCAISFIPKLAI